MSRVPRYPFRVLVTRTPIEGKQQTESHNYTSLAGAIAYRDTALRKPHTKKVDVCMVIDETTPSTCNNIEVEHLNIRSYRAG